MHTVIYNKYNIDAFTGAWVLWTYYGDGCNYVPVTTGMLDYDGETFISCSDVWDHLYNESPLDLVRYVSDYDYELEWSREVNAAIESMVQEFNSWDWVAGQSVDWLRDYGKPILAYKRRLVAEHVMSAKPVGLHGKSVCCSSSLLFKDVAAALKSTKVIFHRGGEVYEYQDNQ